MLVQIIARHELAFQDKKYNIEVVRPNHILQIKCSMLLYVSKKRQYLKNPLLSSCSATIFILDMSISSYPKNWSSRNRLKASPKQGSLLVSSVTTFTGIPNFCRIAEDSLKKPYSNAYSTTYSSSGQTVT
jgi:hypothetical protein